MAVLTRRIGSAGCGQQRSVVRQPAGRPRLAAPKQRSVAARAAEEKKNPNILSREEEPEEYWVSKSERKGANPLADPLAIIGLLAIFSPFALLLIAIATGLVDLSVYR